MKMYKSKISLNRIMNKILIKYKEKLIKLKNKKIKKSLKGGHHYYINMVIIETFSIS